MNVYKPTYTAQGNGGKTYIIERVYYFKNSMHIPYVLYIKFIETTDCLNLEIESLTP